MNRFDTGTFEKLDIMMLDDNYSSEAEIFKDTDNMCYYGTLMLYKVNTNYDNVRHIARKTLVKRVGIYGKTINDVLYDCQEALDWYFSHPSIKGK